jgi:hypothetical protein
MLCGIFSCSDVEEMTFFLVLALVLMLLDEGFRSRV